MVAFAVWGVCAVVVLVWFWVVVAIVVGGWVWGAAAVVDVVDDGGVYVNKERRIMKSKTKSKRTKKPAANRIPFGVGDAILIRTVTHIQVGRVTGITPSFIVLDDCGWVADTGRYSTALATGNLEEFERAPSWCMVGIGAIVDVWPWDHELPKVTK